MASGYYLHAQGLDEPELKHYRQTPEKQYANRIVIDYLVGKNWSVSKVTEARIFDRETVRNHFRRYRKRLRRATEKRGGRREPRLSNRWQQALYHYVRENLYLTAKEIAHHVEQCWSVVYSQSGINQLLRRLGYVYKKPKLVPGKANAEEQRCLCLIA